MTNKNRLEKIDSIAKFEDHIAVLGRTKDKYYIIKCNPSNGKVIEESSFKRWNLGYRIAYNKTIKTINIIKSISKLSN